MLSLFCVLLTRSITFFFYGDANMARKSMCREQDTLEFDVNTFPQKIEFGKIYD